MRKGRLFALFLALTMCLCTLPASAAEGSGWLVPKVKEPPSFADVEGTWCENYVRTVCETGLMEGKSAEQFDPSGPLMPEQLVAVCFRLYSRLTGGDGTVPAPSNGEVWYEPYYTCLAEVLRYEGGADALMLHIHAAKYPVPRWMLVDLLHQTLTAANAIPSQINQITALPDTQDIDVMDFYNAGLLTGVNRYGSFRPNETVSRGQAAAIFARAADPSLRVQFTPESFDLCKDILRVEPEVTALTVGSTAITMEQAAQELCLSLRQEDCDAVSGDIPRDDLRQSLEIALGELASDVAIDRLAARNGLTWTREDLEAEYGPIPVGYQGIREEGWLWEYSHSWLNQRLLILYMERYGSTIDSSTGNTEAEVRFEQDLEAIRNSLAVTASTALENLDLTGTQTRLMALFPCN